MIITAHCRKHPRYKTAYPPTSKCEGCLQLWEIRYAIETGVMPNDSCDVLGSLDRHLHFLGVRPS